MEIKRSVGGGEVLEDMRAPTTPFWGVVVDFNGRKGVRRVSGIEDIRVRVRVGVGRKQHGRRRGRVAIVFQSLSA